MVLTCHRDFSVNLHIPFRKHTIARSSYINKPYKFYLEKKKSSVSMAWR